MMLTVDIGNTCVKWAVWHDARIVQTGSGEYSKQEPENVFAMWNDLQPEKRVMVACVAGEPVELALSNWMQQHWSITPEFLRSTAKQGGVTNAYADPSQYGVDRWAALLGARSRYHDPVCIIDAGTAITVDLLDAGGVHRGGRILPGLQMMREALLEGAAGIHQTEGEATAFADNTADAVSSGTLHMLQAALIEICSSAGQCLGSHMKIIITGGMSEQIMSLPGMPEMLHEPDLVMKGLFAAAEIPLAGD
jgi:type III pantothenate kinase